MMHRNWWLLLALVALLALVLPAGGEAPAKDDVFSRLTPDRLAAKHADVVKYAAARKHLNTLGNAGWQDVRAVIHAHCFISHDSRGTLEQFIAAAKATNTKVVMMSDHPSQTKDYFKDGFSGMHEGVLFFPGAEARGFLIYPRVPLDPDAYQDRQALVDAVLATKGVIFASHIEEWPEAAWALNGMTGSEMYNTHFELKRRPEFADIERNPAKLLALIKGAEKFSHEAFGAIQSPMTEYLTVLDRETQKHKLTMVAANDSHANFGITVKGTEQKGMVVLEDPLGSKLGELDANMVAMLGIPLPKELAPGQVGFSFLLDTYERSFQHTSTHIWVPKLEPEAVLGSLRGGITYVAFDWIADPTGFLFFLNDPSANVQPPARLMGGEVSMKPGMTLGAVLPLPAQLRLVRNGQPVPLPEPEALKDRLKFPVTEKGTYRLEAWLPVGDEVLPWIYSGPIYVR